MRMFRWIGRVAVGMCLAAGVFAVAPVAASAASTLELSSAGGVVKAGDETTFVLGQGDNGPGIQKSVTVETPDGNVVCESEPLEREDELPGTDTTNDEATDDVQLARAALFKSRNPCSSTLLGSPVAEVEWVAPLSPFTLGTLSLSAKHKAVLTAPSPDLIALYIRGGEACRYTYTKLKGTFPAFTNELQPEFTQQKLKEEKAESSASCPSKATLSFSVFFTLTKTNFAIEYAINR
jgi:hypothetical protein